MSNIAPTGTLINLWCIVRENRSIFKITIGSGNDLDDLRKVIKERKPRFNDFAPDELVLWRVNVASNILRNKETAIEPYLNEKLEDPADTVGNTFQNVIGNNIRVVVGVPVIELGRKRKAIEELVKTSRRQWTVNGALRETDWYSKYFMDLMDDEQIIPLLKKIFDGSLTGLYGARASGKTTRILKIINYLSTQNYICNYSSIKQINGDDSDIFWKSFGVALSIGSENHHLIPNAMHLFVIHAIVIVGTFSIMHLDSNVSSSRQSLDSPFNVKDLVRNPNFSLDKVRTLHAGLVCLCGRAIEDNLISKIKGDRILSHGVWVRFKLISLMDEIAQYQTFKRIINSLLDSSAMTAVRFFRDYFLLEDVEHEVKIVDTDSADFLAAEGVLIPVTERAERAFRLSSPMSVPRESVYDSELYRVLWNWLSGFGFQITGQWHLINRNDNNGRNKHSYSDIVITSPRAQVIVLELLATATVGELSEHYNRVLNYARLLSANESWIVHFTCEDDYNEKSHWPSDGLLQQELSVAHFYHDTDFRRVDMTVCWWNNNRNDKSTYKYAVQL
ncbi:1336_t:CDS:2 [Rhizophagus irregularis]|nr:1336_t:CDS:2 [Rhizophagus irregularis]